MPENWITLEQEYADKENVVYREPESNADSSRWGGYSFTGGEIALDRDFVDWEWDEPPKTLALLVEDWEEVPSDD